jgi:hypothetical protein
VGKNTRKFRERKKRKFGYTSCRLLFVGVNPHRHAHIVKGPNLVAEPLFGQRNPDTEADMLTDAGPNLLPVTSPTVGVSSQARGIVHALAVGTALVLVTFALAGVAICYGPPSATRLDSSAEGLTTPVTTGHASSQIPTGAVNDLHEAYTSDPLHWDQHKRDHVKLSVTPCKEGCGASSKELIRPFYVNSGAQSGDPSSLK